MRLLPTLSRCSKPLASANHGCGGLLVAVPAPLLHGAGGSGFWDEIVFLVLIGGFIVSLVFAAFMSRRRRKKRNR
jgi:LPXTG-motif cell wall-anchored protein